MKEEELKKIDITKWEEKTHFSHLPMHHGSALFNVNRYLNEIEDILREAGMEGLGYQDQEKEIEELIEDQANLNAYINSAGWEFQDKIDTPLYKGFQNDAAEKLSRINLDDYTTENTLEIKKHHVMYDSYGNQLEYDTTAPSLSMADFLGISSLGTGSVGGKLVGIPEEFKDFTSMFTMEYDSIKENLKDKDGNPISLEEYLNELHTYGEFDNKMDKPFLEFVSCILDVTMLKPLIEMCWGYDLITGEDLSDFERGMKGVFAVIDVVSLMIGIKASGVVKIFSKNTLKMAGKSVLLDAFGGAGAYGIGQIGQELELPLPITLLMSMGAGIGIVKVGGRYLFKDQAGNVLLDVAEKDVDALRKGAGGAKPDSEILVDTYKNMRNNPEVTGQAHHLNQDAAFRDVIPKNEGMSVELQGNVFKDVGSQHYNAHESMEGFWNQFRSKGSSYGEVPTITEYNSALYDSLKAAGYTDGQAQQAVQSAINQQLQYNLQGNTFVPRIPGKINLPKYQGG